MGSKTAWWPRFTEWQRLADDRKESKRSQVRGGPPAVLVYCLARYDLKVDPMRVIERLVEANR